MARLRDRPTSDLLILMIAGTICSSVLGAAFVVAILAFVHPEQDAGKALALISDTLNTLIGLLAGYVAGRSNLETHPPKTPNQDAERARELGGSP